MPARDENLVPIRSAMIGHPWGHVDGVCFVLLGKWEDENGRARTGLDRLSCPAEFVCGLSTAVLSHRLSPLIVK